MRFLKFNSLLLLMQIWNDLTRWLVLYNSWIALISCWWFGFFSFPFFFFNPLTWMCFCTGFLQAPVKGLFVIMPIFQSFSQPLRSQLRSVGSSRFALPWPHIQPTCSTGYRAGQGSSQAALSPPLLLQAPKEREAAKAYFFQWQLTGTYWVFLNVPGLVWNILQILILFQSHIISVK